MAACMAPAIWVAPAILFRKQDRKLLAAIARGHVTQAAQHALQLGTDGAQASVACRMTILIIEGRKVVDIHHNQRKWPPVAQRALELALYRLVKGAAIGKPR
jgi:hypothetical protein